MSNRTKQKAFKETSQLLRGDTPHFLGEGGDGSWEEEEERKNWKTNKQKTVEGIPYLACENFHSRLWAGCLRLCGQPLESSVPLTND